MNLPLLFLFPVLAIAIVALVWWAVLERGARPLAAMLVALMVMPLPASAGALDAITAAFAPHLPYLMNVVLIPFIVGLCVRGMKLMGLNVEESRRSALHSAFATAANLALANKLTGKAAIDLIMQYVTGSVPDAIKDLGASRSTLLDLAEAKLEQAIQAQAKASADGVADALTGALRKAGALPG